MGHSRSSATSPFDRAHTTSYSTLIETMRLSCTVFGQQSSLKVVADQLGQQHPELHKSEVNKGPYANVQTARAEEQCSTTADADEGHRSLN